MKPESVAKFSVTHKGTFNLEIFYESLYSWLQDKEYTDLKENDDFYEILYQEIVSGDMKFIDLWWRPQKTLNKYIKQNYAINFQIIGLKKVEIQQGQKTIKTNSAEIILGVEAKLTFDYDNLWEKSDFVKFLSKTIMKNKIAGMKQEAEDEFSGEVKELQTFIKDHFSISKPAVEPFHPLSR